MNVTGFSVCVVGLAMAWAGQQAAPAVPEVLANDFSKLSALKALKVQFTKRVGDGPPKAYTLELSRGDRFKLTSDEGFVLSDGTSVYVYKKEPNTYTQSDLNPAQVAKFGRRMEVLGWAPFFQSNPGADLLSAKLGEIGAVEGHPSKTVELTLRADNSKATLFIDPTLGFTSGIQYKVKDKSVLIFADKLETVALPEKEFTFVIPDGAKLTQEEGSFASVQALLNTSCMPCHNSDHKRAGVDLTDFSGIAGCVTAGKSSTSLLIKALKGDGVELMPKGRSPLTDSQIAEISTWVDGGAKNE
jgi:outer membrane lipoprotein-sorting protein